MDKNNNDLGFPSVPSKAIARCEQHRSDAKYDAEVKEASLNQFLKIEQKAEVLEIINNINEKIEFFNNVYKTNYTSYNVMKLLPTSITIPDLVDGMRTNPVDNIRRDLKELDIKLDVFKRDNNVPVAKQNIDKWNALCKEVETLLKTRIYWNIEKNTKTQISQVHSGNKPSVSVNNMYGGSVVAKQTNNYYTHSNQSQLQSRDLPNDPAVFGDSAKQKNDPRSLNIDRGLANLKKTNEKTKDDACCTIF